MDLGHVPISSFFHSRKGRRCLLGGRRVPGQRNAWHLTWSWGLGPHPHVSAAWSWKEGAVSGAGAFLPLGSGARLPLLILTGRRTGSRHRACLPAAKREGRTGWGTRRSAPVTGGGHCRAPPTPPPHLAHEPAWEDARHALHPKSVTRRGLQRGASSPNTGTRRGGTVAFAVPFLRGF